MTAHERVTTENVLMAHYPQNSHYGGLLVTSSTLKFVGIPTVAIVKEHRMHIKKQDAYHTLWLSRCHYEVFFRCDKK